MSQENLTSAFLMEGLHIAGYQECIQRWGQGCIEMVQEMVGYVPFMTSQAYEAANKHGGYPGVFDYEVSVEFGKWFGEFIISNGAAPSKKEAEDWLKEEIEAFFTQCVRTRNQVAKVKASPTVAVVIQGGLVQNLISQIPLDYIIVDHDTEGADGDEMYSFVSRDAKGQGSVVVVVGSRSMAEVNPDEVARIAAGLAEAVTRVEHITYDEFCERFKPIKNTIDTNASLDGTMFETFGAELEAVMQMCKTSPKCVWTLLDGDEGDEATLGARNPDEPIDNSFIGDGFHYVNRQGYLITQVPAEEHVSYVVFMDDVRAQAAKESEAMV